MSAIPLFDANEIKVSHNQKHGFYYHRKSKLVFKSKNDLSVIGSFYCGRVHPLDVVDIEGCRLYNLTVDQEALDKCLEKMREFHEEQERLRIEKMENQGFVQDNEIRISNDLKTEDIKTEIDTDKCSICLDNKRCIALIPCGHTCYCKTCFKAVKEHGNIESCPLCRTKVQSAIQPI